MSNLVTVHEEFITRIYRASRCSGAYFWRIISAIASILLPLIICFVTQGMWKKTNNYLEQPNIEFSRKCFFILANPSETNEYYFWSSFQKINDINSERLILPIIESKASDYDNNGKADEFNIDISLTLPNSSLKVTYVFYYLQFKVFLDYRSVMELDAPIIGSIDRSYPSNQAFIFGDLNFLQKIPLPAYGNYEFLDNFESDNTTEYGNLTNSFQVDDSLIQLFPLELHYQNMKRNYTLDIISKTEYFMPYIIDGENNEFIFHFHFNTRLQVLTYRTSAMELLKWFWLQYFTIFVLTKLLFSILSSFLYENQILSTLVTNPFKEQKYE